VLLRGQAERRRRSCHDASMSHHQPPTPPLPSHDPLFRHPLSGLPEVLHATRLQVTLMKQLNSPTAPAWCRRSTLGTTGPTSTSRSTAVHGRSASGPLTSD
jgi:hypothetical protein